MASRITLPTAAHAEVGKDFQIAFAVPTALGHAAQGSVWEQCGIGTPLMRYSLSSPLSAPPSRTFSCVISAPHLSSKL
ncbi:hypothetical protein VTO73DRAFT_4733 [Trametes versicolor]